MATRQSTTAGRRPSLGKLWEFVSSLTAAQRFTLGVLISLGLSVLDALTGYEVSFSPFYLVSVVLVAWSGRRWPVMAIAVVDATLWQASNYFAGEVHAQAWIYAWNALTRGVFFVVIGLLIVRLRQMLTAEAATARRDPLTGLANRRGFEERFELEVLRQQRQPSTLGLLALDLDRFKLLNDSLGHAEGDRLLIEFAKVGLATIRPEDCFARIGGDEFVLLVARAERKAVEDIALRLQTKAEALFAERSWPVGLSQGLAFYAVGGPLELPAFLARADRQLYRAKHEGRARICVESEA